MDEDTVGKLLGFVQWSQEAFWNKQEYEGHKAEVIQTLNETCSRGFEANKHLIKQLVSVTDRKQMQMNIMNIEVYSEMLFIMENIVPLFAGMHAELFVKEIENSLKRIHKNTVALHDVVKNQSRVLNAIEAETYEDFMPHISYLYDKEIHIKNRINEHVNIVHCNGKKLVKHLNANYFGQLGKIIDNQFRTDHSEILQATYFISTISRSVAKLHGKNAEELYALETKFTGNIAPFK